MLTVRARRLAARSATPKCIASRRRDDGAIASTLAIPSAVSPIVLEQRRDDMLAGLLLVGGGDGIFQVEEDAIGCAVERLPEQGRLRAGHRQLTALQPGMRGLVAGETHALTAVREAGPGFPGGGGGASGVCGAAPRAASGAAVLR